MTAALTVPAPIGAPGMFLKSTLFSPGAAAVRPASLGLTPKSGGGLAEADDEQPAR